MAERGVRLWRLLDAEHHWRSIALPREAMAVVNGPGAKGVGSQHVESQVSGGRDIGKSQWGCGSCQRLKDFWSRANF
jgi:hypothetical protein